MNDGRLEESISLRITKEMKDLLEAQAKDLGIKPGTLATRLLKLALMPEQNADIVSKYTDKLTQIAHNVYTPPASDASLHDRVAQLETHLERLPEIIENAIQKSVGNRSHFVSNQLREVSKQQTPKHESTRTSSKEPPAAI